MSKYVNMYDKTVPQKAPEIDFNLKIYRERITDKYQKMELSPLQKQLQSPTTPIKSKRNQSPSAPSFESLQGKLRDYSFVKLKQAGESKDGSPSRFAGMQLKIQSISSPQAPLKSGRNSGSLYLSSGPVTEGRYNMPSMQSMRFETDHSDSGKKYDYKIISVATLVPLHEIVNLRAKLEQANFSQSGLSSTYITEMVKLAQVITTQLKRQNK